MQIRFKAKAQKHYTGREYIQVKKNLSRGDIIGDHAYSNSNMFPQILARISAALIPSGMIFLDAVPAFVQIEGDFMKTVTINASGDEWRAWK